MILTYIKLRNFRSPLRGISSTMNTPRRGAGAVLLGGGAAGGARTFLKVRVGPYAGFGSPRTEELLMTKM
jgi:hypothetical protein